MKHQETIQSLMGGIIDYAGLFPPASLEMAPAVAEYAHQFESAESWMLGRFVVPSARLGELADAAADPWQTARGPWELSVLAPGDLEENRQRIEAFGTAHAASARIAAIERSIATPDEVQPALDAFAGLEVYFEIPYKQDPSLFMEALAQFGGRAKIRSGGVTEDAFPSSFELARFVVAAARAGVPFKATAGLHHPLRGEYRLTYEDGSPDGTMHGFVNVFLAAAWVKTANLGIPDVEALLEERNPQAIQFVDDQVSWREWTLQASELESIRREFATSYGSCSFREPLEGLQELDLL